MTLLFLQHVPSNKPYRLLFDQKQTLCLRASAGSLREHNLHCCSSPPGLIWSRYSLVIIPKNWNLFCVNFFVGGAGASQLFRIWRSVDGVCTLTKKSFRLNQRAVKCECSLLQQVQTGSEGAGEAGRGFLRDPRVDHAPPAGD